MPPDQPRHDFGLPQASTRIGHSARESEPRGSFSPSAGSATRTTTQPSRRSGRACKPSCSNQQVEDPSRAAHRHLRLDRSVLQSKPARHLTYGTRATPSTTQTEPSPGLPQAHSEKRSTHHADSRTGPPHPDPAAPGRVFHLHRLSIALRESLPTFSPNLMPAISSLIRLSARRMADWRLCCA